MIAPVYLWFDLFLSKWDLDPSTHVLNYQIFFCLRPNEFYNRSCVSVVKIHQGNVHLSDITYMCFPFSLIKYKFIEGLWKKHPPIETMGYVMIKKINNATSIFFICVLVLHSQQKTENI